MGSICHHATHVPPHPAQVSSSAYDAAAQLWPRLFDSLPDAERQRVMAGMRATRPRLVKGFEAMVRLVILFQFI